MSRIKKDGKYYYDLFDIRPFLVASLLWVIGISICIFYLTNI